MSLIEETLREVAVEFLLSYKRFASPSGLFRLLRRELAADRPEKGSLRLLRLWILQYFRKDFWKGGRKGRESRLSRVIGLLGTVSQKRAELQYDANRVKLAILRQHRECTRPVKALSELAVLKVGASAADRTAARFFSFPPHAVAEQLTLLEFNIFRCIEPEEFVGKAWATSSTKTSPLATLVRRSDEVSFWVASVILCQPTLPAQVRAAHRFILIAQWCERLGNYNSLMEILGGFHVWCVSRLQSIWPTDKYKTLLQYLTRIMSPQNNYAAYRRTLAKRREELAGGVPTLPYMGLFLKDLTFIEDGNEDLLEGGKINVPKLAMLGATLRVIRAFQAVDYSRQIKGKITPLLKYLASLPRLKEDELNRASEAFKPARRAAGSVSEDLSLSVSSADGPDLSAPADAPSQDSKDSDEVSDLIDVPAAVPENGDLRYVP